MFALNKIILFFCVFSVVSSIRILGIFPIPYHSHQSVFQVLVEELARHGHELVVLTPLPHEKPIQNVTEIDVHDVSYKLWEDVYQEFSKIHQGVSVDPVELFDLFSPVIIELLDYQLSTKEMQAIFRDETQYFDIILTEACISPAVIVAARFKVPIIQVSSFYGSDENFLTVGAPIHPLIFPEYTSTSCNIKGLTLWEKLSELYTYLRIKIIQNKIRSSGDHLIKKHFGDSTATIDELHQNVHMLFINAHHIWDNNRPVPPSVIYMGALHLKKVKPISKELQTYLDSSKNGVLYMSLGSKLRFSDLPSNTIKTVFDIFASLPYDVLVKWNGEDLPNTPSNVRLEKWLPQNDMLHHPKIKVFITQGGLQSTDEAIAAKVPLIGLPIYGDQFYNVQKYIQHGIGTYLDINNLDANELRKTILAIAEEKSYRENIGRLSRIMEEQRAGGLRKAVYWTEYVAAHGALHLRSPLADVTLVEYFMLDVIGFIIAAATIFSVLLYIAVKLLIRKFVEVFYDRRKFKSN